MNKAKINVTDRQIAIEFAKRLPLEGDSFASRVNELERKISKMPTEARIALKASYIFAHKLPREERKDAFSEFTMKLLEAKIKDEKLAYAICRCDWKDYWRKLKIKSQFQFLSIVETEDVETEDKEKHHAYVLSETLVGECEFETVMNGKIEAKRIWAMLPCDIKRIVAKRIAGFGITSTQRSRLARWIKSSPMVLAHS